MSTSTPSVSLADRVKGTTLRGALRLPARVKRVIAGRPVVLDDQELDLDTQLLLSLQRLGREKGAETFPIAVGRSALAAQSALVAGDLPIGEVHDAEAGGVPVRVYRPRSRRGQTAPLPTLVFLHGGGFIYGDGHSTHDGVCRFFAEQADVQVISVDYRLAPEHPFPAAHLDCLAAFTAIVSDPSAWQVDASRVAVGGDSAGGNLSAFIAVEAARAGLPLAYQLLIYPMAQSNGEAPSRRTFDSGFFLTREFLDLAELSYLPDEESKKDPRVDLVSADLPDGICPGHLVTAGFDPLRDEGELYADRLVAAGVELTVDRRPGLIHGFANWVGIESSSRDAVVDLAARLAKALRA